jgi:hypothetical protein
MRGALGALLFLVFVACRNDEPRPSSSSAESPPTAPAPPATSSPGPTTAATVSQWHDANTPETVELVVAPERAAVVAFDVTKGGYVLTRGARANPLPREWFGAGPPRRDLSVSADGRRLVVPDGSAAVVYDTDAKRWLARLDAPRAGSEAKISADGKHVRWTAPGAPCSMTEIDTKVLVKSCP